MISIKMKKKIAQVECQQGQEWAHYALAYRLIKLQSCFIDTILKLVNNEHVCRGLIPWNPFSVLCLW